MPECPICGNELDEESAPTCDHLIADWPDGSDGDDGILGSASSTRAALDRLPQLYNSFCRLVDLAAGRDEEPPGEERDEAELDEQRLEGLRTRLVGRGPEPAWYETFEDCVNDVAIPSYRHAATLIEAAIKKCPGIEETGELLGGPMISTLWTFVWAKDPAVGIAAVDREVAQLTHEIDRAASTLRDVPSRQPSPGDPGAHSG